MLGASHPEELIEQAFSYSYTSLAINDFGGVYGLARSYLDHKHIAASSLQSQKILLHYGAELHLQQDHKWPVLLQDTLALVALNKSGYAALCSLFTEAHKKSKTEAYLPLEMLAAFPLHDLLAIQPMRGCIRTFDDSALQMRIAALRDLFPGRFYLAMSRHFHYSEDNWLERVLRLVRTFHLPTLMSQDAFFHRPERKPLSDVLHSIRCNKPLQQAGEHFFPNQERCFHSLSFLEGTYSSLPLYQESLRYSREIAELCDFSLQELSYKYPQEFIPEGETADSFLHNKAWQGAKEYYKGQVPDKVSQLLQKELLLIKELGFADYFLTVWDIVRWARQQKILCQGRGSAANSAVCFCLGVTSVDPSQFDLLFERFISKERGDPPDIDVDFEHERREEVLQYVYQRYGRHRAAMVANVITFRRKGSLRATGKALGISPDIIDRCSKLSKMRYFRGEAEQELLKELQVRLLADGEESLPESLLQHWLYLSSLLKGFPKHLGIHSGGFMISHTPLQDLVVVEPATMEGRTVVQWCKEDIEGMGFFKIDLLALGMLSAIRKCFDLISQVGGPSLSLASLPQEDSETYGMVQKADTVGVFQIESRAQMSMLPRLRPKTFYDLVIQVAIIRPGPIQGKVIHPYLKRRAGLESVCYPDERLRPILQKTLGVPIFQEQLMRVAMTVGDFTPGEANELRKNIGLWNIKDAKRTLGPWMEKLLVGMRKNRLPEPFIQQILEQMRGFADYGFPESHAVSFAFLAYASSYLKCHYPGAFFTAVLNAQPMGFYSPHSLLQTAARCGVVIKELCVNFSDWDHLLVEKGYGIRLGLRLIHGLSKKGAEALVAVRKKNGAFRDFFDFYRRVSLGRDDLWALAAARAMNCFGLSPAELIWQSARLPVKPLLEGSEHELKLAPADLMTQIEEDFKSYGTSLREHPVSLIKRDFWNYQIPKNRIIVANKLSVIQHGGVVACFAMVLVKQSPPSAKGIVFLTAEDETGFINMIIKPHVYQIFYPLIEEQTFLCFTGRVQKSGEQRSILVQYIDQKVQPNAVDMKKTKSKNLKSVNTNKQKMLFNIETKTRNFM